MISCAGTPSAARPLLRVAGRRPSEELFPEHQTRLTLLQDERAVGEPREPCLVKAARARVGVEALGVQLGVHRIGADLAGVEPAPDRREADVVLAPAESARAVPGCERRRLVEEEELGEQARLEERAPLPAPELEPAGDPPLRGVPPSDPACVVVEAAAVSVDEPARRARDQLTERRDAVLQRHRPRVGERVCLTSATVIYITQQLDNQMVI